MKRSRKAVATLLITFGLATAPLAAGAEPSASDRETARALLIDGRLKFKTKDYQGALHSFQAAHAIMRVPTTGLDLARAQEAVGHLVEARITALDVVQMAPAPDEPEAFTKARLAARELVDALAARIPSLVISIRGGPPGAEVQVTVDGAPLPPASLSLPRKVNPGLHTIVVSALGHATMRRDVTVEERATLPVTIELEPITGGESATVAPPRRDAPERPTSKPIIEPDAGVPAWVWMAGGTGIAALGGSILFAIDLANTKSEVAQNCPNNNCGSRYTQEEVDAVRARWNRDVALSIGLGAVSVLALGAATTGIVTRSSKTREGDSTKGTAFVPWIGSKGGGLITAGNF